MRRLNNKLAQREDEQARLFPDLAKEISARRSKLNTTEWDQSSKAYKDHLCGLVKRLELCPAEYVSMVCERIVRSFSDCFWDDGCAAPAIIGFKARIDLKPDANVKYRQPYRLSKFDETRLSYLYEESEVEGKVERYQLGETPRESAHRCLWLIKREVL